MRGLQNTFAELGQLPGKKTRRERTLETLDGLLPWGRWAAIVGSFWSDPEGAGRRRTPVETMLRMTVVQRLWNLSDEGCEDLCCDSRSAAAFLRAAKLRCRTRRHTEHRAPSERRTTHTACASNGKLLSYASRHDL